MRTVALFIILYMAALYLFATTTHEKLEYKDSLDMSYISSLLGGEIDKIEGISLMQVENEQACMQMYSFSQQHTDNFRMFLTHADNGILPGGSDFVITARMRILFEASEYGDVHVLIHESERDALFLERRAYMRKPGREAISTLRLEKARLPGAGTWLMDMLQQEEMQCV